MLTVIQFVIEWKACATNDDTDKKLSTLTKFLNTRGIANQLNRSN